MWVENKKDDWKVATLREVIEGGATVEDVSINKLDKKGRSFPKFDDIGPGSMIAGNLWQNPNNQKYTLYAPDEPKAPTVTAGAAPNARPAPTMGGGNRGVAAAQARKAEGIEKAQDRKEAGITVAAAMRDSTLIAAAIITGSPEPFTTEDFQALFVRIKKWYLSEWKATEDAMDVPF